MARVAKTTDAGRNWQLVWKEDSNPGAEPARNIHDAWITARFGSDWAKTLGACRAEQDANVSYGTDLEEPCARPTAAQVGSPYTHEIRRDGWVSTGLDVTNAYGYHLIRLITIGSLSPRQILAFSAARWRAVLD